MLAAFAAGFVLGPLRELVLVPAVGRLAALLVELPLLLGFCAWIAPRITRRCAVRAPLAMGLCALALLLVLEFSVGVAIRGWNLAEWLADFATLPGLVTLLGYGIFAVLPAWRGLAPRGR